jgi:hypothetical protein
MPNKIQEIKIQNMSELIPVNILIADRSYRLKIEAGMKKWCARPLP